MEKKIAKVLFIRDFEGNKAGGVVAMTASQLQYFGKRDCIEIMEISTPEPQPEPAPAKTVKVKRSKKAESK